MGVAEIPELSLFGEGVTFQYLAISLKRGEEQEGILRGLNYTPYSGDAKEGIVSRLQTELEDLDFFDQGGEFSIAGGGSIAMNPYNETIVLFGQSQSCGAEENREASAKALERAFPDHSVEWHPPQEKPPEKAPAKKEEE